ncbi:MAG: DMT family transporter [Anaeromyxobacter sp.]
MAVHLVMLLHSVISAGTYLAAKRALDELPPWEVALVRFTLAGLVFGGLLLARRARIARKDLPGFLALGFVAVPLNQGFFLAGLSLSTPGHAALLYALTPIFVFILAHLRLGERVSLAKLLGIGVAFAGVVIVLLARGSVAFGGNPRLVVGDLLMLLAVVAWAIFAVAGKVYAERYGAVVSTSTAIALGALMYVPVGLWMSDFHRLANTSAAGWASLGYLVFFTSVAAYLLYYWALARAEASRVAIWSNLQPVLTAAAAWALYGERLTGPFLVGGAMVLLGVVLTERG